MSLQPQNNTTNNNTTTIQPSLITPSTTTTTSAIKSEVTNSTTNTNNTINNNNENINTVNSTTGNPSTAPIKSLANTFWIQSVFRYIPFPTNKFPTASQSLGTCNMVIGDHSYDDVTVYTHPSLPAGATVFHFQQNAPDSYFCTLHGEIKVEMEAQPISNFGSPVFSPLGKLMSPGFSFMTPIGSPSFAPFALGDQNQNQQNVDFKAVYKPDLSAKQCSIDEIQPYFVVDPKAGGMPSDGYPITFVKASVNIKQHLTEPLTQGVDSNNNTGVTANINDNNGNIGNNNNNDNGSEDSSTNTSTESIFRNDSAFPMYNNDDSFTSNGISGTKTSTATTIASFNIVDDKEHCIVPSKLTDKYTTPSFVKQDTQQTQQLQSSQSHHHTRRTHHRQDSSGHGSYNPLKRASGALSKQPGLPFKRLLQDDFNSSQPETPRYVTADSMVTGALFPVPVRPTDRFSLNEDGQDGSSIEHYKITPGIKTPQLFEEAAELLGGNMMRNKTSALNNTNSNNTTTNNNNGFYPSIGMINSGGVIFNDINSNSGTIGTNMTGQPVMTTTATTISYRPTEIRQIVPGRPDTSYCTAAAAAAASIPSGTSTAVSAAQSAIQGMSSVTALSNLVGSSGSIICGGGGSGGDINVGVDMAIGGEQKARKGTRKRMTGNLQRQGQEAGEGVHDCQWADCSCSFRTVAELTNHLQVCHTSVQTTFKCMWRGCNREGKPFVNHSGLFRHLRYHTGDKPCKCTFEGCGFSSVDNGELRRHIKLVHHHSDPSWP